MHSIITRTASFFPTMIVVVLMLSGCVSKNVPVIVKLDPQTVWSKNPLSNLATHVTQLYAPTVRSPELTLTRVLWQPSKSDIPTEFTPANPTLNGQIWNIETVYGSEAERLWIYVSQDIQQMQEVTEALSHYRKTERKFDLMVDGQFPVSTIVLESDNQQAYAVSFKVNSIDIVAIWNRSLDSQMYNVLNSLTLVLANQPLAVQLEQELQLNSVENVRK